MEIAVVAARRLSIGALGRAVAVARQSTRPSNLSRPARLLGRLTTCRYQSGLTVSGARPRPLILDNPTSSYYQILFMSTTATQRAFLSLAGADPEYLLADVAMTRSTPLLQYARQ